MAGDMCRENADREVVWVCKNVRRGSADSVVSLAAPSVYSTWVVRGGGVRADFVIVVGVMVVKMVSID